MFPWRLKALFPFFCLVLGLPFSAGAQGVPGMRETVTVPETPASVSLAEKDPILVMGATAKTRKQSSDPFLAAVLGALPLLSGFYLTSEPQKGAAFTLADAVLIGTIVRIRSDKNTPPKDAAVYYYLLGAVNLADLALSVMQVRADADSRLSVNLNPSDPPGLQLAWRF